jgi:hypothetical protein
MNRSHRLSSGRVVLTFFVAAASSLAAGPPARIHADLQDRQTFVLRGNTRRQLKDAVDQGAVDPSLALPRIAIHFKLTAAQQADLDGLLRAQQDPASPLYHKWLNPEQYADRFGLSPSDLAKITAWLERMGFANVQIARSRTFVTMSGTAAQARTAFQTPIRHYRVNGSLHYANAADPVLPIELRGVVGGIRGLDDFRPHPHVRPRPRFTSPLSGKHYFAPGDFTTVYGLQPLYSSGIDGTGQSIAVAGQTDIQLSDIEAFQRASGLPVKDPTIVLDGVDPGVSSTDLSEADLDLEWAGAVAPGATIIYVNSMDAFGSATYAIDQNLASVVSLTYGGCEFNFSLNQLNTMNSVFAQANAQGITVVVASGDAGAADCDESFSATSPPPSIATQGLAVDFPASSPFVTAVGGTEFNEGTGTYWGSTNGPTAGSALSYIPEMAWNDTAADGTLSASGGGASAFFAKPSWQQGPGVPNDGVRDVPDVALNASGDHDAFLYCSGGWCVDGFRNAQTFLDVVGGTSCGAPTFAGVVALLNQKAHSVQGNVNPTLYSLAATSPEAFHDVTVGGNQVPCLIGSLDCTTGTLGYAAGPGYDQATGLGSPNAHNLITAAAAPTPTPPPAPVQTSPANRAANLTAPFTLIWESASGAMSYNVYFGAVSPPPLVTGTSATSYDPGALLPGVTYFWAVAAVNSVGSTKSPTWSFQTSVSTGPGGQIGLEFVPVTPCRIADTRGAVSAFGGPTLTAGSVRSFTIPQSGCGIPGSAQAYSLNVTVVPRGGLPYLTLWPTGQSQPTVSTLNSFGGGIVANAAIVPAGTGGAVSVFVAGTTDVILDIDGYFAPPPGGASFYTVAPCRVADTRNPLGLLGGPSLAGGQTRDFPVSSSSCGLPSSAGAYSMNVTVVPSQPLAFLTAWPTGQPRPNVSTLNSFEANIVANAAIVPAGTGGDISVYATGATNAILDTNGYFSSPGSAGALFFYPVAPCRVADTRSGTIMGANTSRSFSIPTSGCSIPSTAAAYSLNVTVVPAGPLAYLTAWPAGSAQPAVSTLNSFSGAVVANAALVPAGTNGAINVFVTGTTHVILDINGYFAP